MHQDKENSICPTATPFTPILGQHPGRGTPGRHNEVLPEEPCQPGGSPLGASNGSFALLTSPPGSDLAELLGN